MKYEMTRIDEEVFITKSFETAAFLFAIPHKLHDIMWEGNRPTFIFYGPDKIKKDICKAFSASVKDENKFNDHLKNLKIAWHPK